MERCFIEDWSIMKSSPLDATDERSGKAARRSIGIRQARASQEPSESKNQSDQSSQTLSD
ncbi:predicted protein [Plenodomus lingam JN3]|uniref:Predicted protein n=1 Tax=Leptosphaeria maculans (strain JN3 / isolate v23.1.3 / race Av1-4-5-6-7-8) TaxID=985895 RepID=E5A210_LEPMJ|nr:predicted protein [Plenodomus lingam JN3]CBX97727.1 predicted protein [Plenodomus lingam JN3]